jgi:hypothetical protein
MPTLRPAGDDRPRRRGDDVPPGKTGGTRRVWLTPHAVGIGLLVLVGVGGGVVMYLTSGPRMTMLAGSRETNAQGGTTAVTVTMRTAADSPGGRVGGKYYFVFSSGGRTAVADANVIGRAAREWHQRFLTPELATETGPVTFRVEQRDGGSVSRVSPDYTIP